MGSLGKVCGLFFSCSLGTGVGVRGRVIPAKLIFCVYNNASSIVLHNVKLDGRPLTLTHDTDKNVYKSGLGVMCGWGLGRS